MSLFYKKQNEELARRLVALRIELMEKEEEYSETQKKLSDLFQEIQDLKLLIAKLEEEK